MDPQHDDAPADAATPHAPPPVDLDPRTGDPREIMRVLLPAARRDYVRAWEALADPATPLERRRIGREKTRSLAEDHALVAAALRARERQLTGDDLLNARHLIGELDRHAAALERLSTISPIGLQEASDLRPEALGCGKRYRDPARAAETAPAERRPAGTGRSGERRGGKPGGGRPGGGAPAGGRPGGAGSGGNTPAGGKPGSGTPGAGGRSRGGKPNSGGRSRGGTPGAGATPGGGAGAAGSRPATGSRPAGSRPAGNRSGPPGAGVGGRGPGGSRGDRPGAPRGPKVPRDQLGTTKHDSQLGDDLDEATRAKLEELRRQLEG